MNISFGTHQVMTLKRTPLHSYTEFMAICGGLFGLFLGLSIFNSMQFAYNLLIRLWYAFRHSSTENNVIPFHTEHNIIFTINNPE